jgi:hypothetical protein
MVANSWANLANCSSVVGVSGVVFMGLLSGWLGAVLRL